MEFSAFFNRKSLSNRKTRSLPRVTALSTSSFSSKSVCLYDWWLIKPSEGVEGLAVGGFSSIEGENIKAFRSGVISKRVDATTLETLDGFTISLVGFINKDFTTQNGFASEVCSQFQFGFSYDWEEYTAKGSTLAPSAHTFDSVRRTVNMHSRNMINNPQKEDAYLRRDHDPLMRSHQESDCDVQTLKAMEDLFQCIRDLECKEISSPTKDNTVSMSEAYERTQRRNSHNCFNQEACVLATEVSLERESNEENIQSEFSNDPPIMSKPDHIDTQLESDHIILPIKRKYSSMQVSEVSFRLERINGDSATGKSTSSEKTTRMKAGGTTKINVDKDARSRRITRSMTKENHPRTRK